MGDPDDPIKREEELVVAMELLGMSKTETDKSEDELLAAMGRHEWQKQQDKPEALRQTLRRAKTNSLQPDEQVLNKAYGRLEQRIIDGTAAALKQAKRNSRLTKIHYDMDPYHGTKTIPVDVARLRDFVKRFQLKWDTVNKRLKHPTNPTKNAKFSTADFAADGRLRSGSSLMAFYYDLRLFNQEEWDAITIEWRDDFSAWPKGYKGIAQLSEVQGTWVEYLVPPPAGYNYAADLMPTLFPGHVQYMTIPWPNTPVPAVPTAAPVATPAVAAPPSVGHQTAGLAALAHHAPAAAPP